MNRAWRAYGQGGGNIYFNVHDAYGNVPKERSWQHFPGYDRMTESNYLHSADWRLPSYEIYAQANRDFCGFIGGAPEHVDKTHAYYAGETVKKQIVLIWDGVGKRSEKVKVKVEKTGKTAGETAWEESLVVDLATGDVRKVPFEFKAPEVKDKTELRLIAEFGDGTIDEFPIEVYPRPFATVPGGRNTVALFDPTGEGAKILDALGAEYRRLASCDEMALEANRSVKMLVIGPNALAASALSVDPAAVKRGLKVLVLNQPYQAWEALGFRTMDTVPRIMFTHFPEYGFADDALRYWRGAPKCGGREFGALQPHQAPRGPRWRYTHALAHFVLQIPDEPGFVPLTEGEFDLGYTTALQLRAGEGAVTFSTFDFTDRIPSDPAATVTARALFRAAGEGVKSVGRRGRGFWSRLRGDANAPADDKVLERVLTLVGGEETEPLPALHVMGPYNRQKDLRKVFEPVESMAIAGDANPNGDYGLPQGGKANWRTTVTADESGMFDFAAVYPTNAEQMCYSICKFERRRAGRAKLYLGFDWSGRVWVNGKLVFETRDGALRPQFELMVELRKGRNVIAFKTLSDRVTGGHRIWAKIEKESLMNLKNASREVIQRPLYLKPLSQYDPYAFYYW